MDCGNPVRLAAWAAISICLALGSSVRAEPTGRTPGPPASPDTIENLVVRYEGDRLTLHAIDVPVRRILEELGQQSGAALDLRALQDRRVTHRFDALPLEDALQRLLDEQSFLAHYAIVRAQEGHVIGSRLTKLEVVGRAGERLAAKMPRPPAPPARPLRGVETEAAQSAVEQYGGVLHRNREVRLNEGQALAAALGTTNADVTQVFAAAFQHQDAAVRIDAAKTMARVFDADDEMLSLGSGMDVEQMSTAVRAVAGPNAEEFVRTIAQSLQNPALRAQARAILAALQR